MNRIRFAAVGLALTCCVGPTGALCAGAPPAKETPLRVLMVVGGVAHDYEALPRQLAADLAKGRDLDVAVTADLAVFSDAGLKDVDVLLFNTCLDTRLSDAQKAAILGCLRRGKGIVALHCAFWSFQDWPEWRKAIGGLVLGHDPFGTYDNIVVDPANPIAAGVPARFTVADEPYVVEERGEDIHVIVQTTDPHGKQKIVQPQAWTTRYNGGRIFSMTFGHDAKVQTHPAFLTLLANGIRWAGGRLGPATTLSELERREGFEPLFDGKTLKGWKCEPQYWKVADGCIVGDSRPKALDKFSYAITERSFGDFVLRFSVKLSPGGNSGVQFRSEELPRYEVAGYQADVVANGWGNLHEQNGRRKLVDGWPGKGEKAANLTDWNEMEVSAKGPRIIIKVNGTTTADYTETDTSRPRSGIIALQLHKGDAMEVRFTNLRIRPMKAAE